LDPFNPADCDLVYGLTDFGLGRMFQEHGASETRLYQAGLVTARAV